MKTIKVIRIIARLNIGGPAIHTILLSSSLNGTGFYKDILISGTPGTCEGEMSGFARNHGVRPLFIPELVREVSFRDDIRAFFKIYDVIKMEGPDIVHTHTAKAGALGRLAAIFAGVPIKVHTFHGHVFDGYFSPLKAQAFLWVERFLAIFTDRIITVSECVRNEVVGKLGSFGGKRCTVVPLGLELERFIDCGRSKGEFRRSIKVDDDTALVGIVGRLVPIKNHRMFLETALKVKRERPGLKVKFVIVGDGESRSSLEKCADLMGLRNDVIFTGWIDDLAAVYADLDIVALTSLNEGTPVSLIEAMASGKAVVSTSVGGVKDLIEDGVNGILVRPGDAEGLAERLCSLLSDAGKRGALGSAGRNSVVKKYTKERLVKDIDNLYRDLIRQKTV